VGLASAIWVSIGRLTENHNNSLKIYCHPRSLGQQTFFRHKNHNYHILPLMDWLFEVVPIFSNRRTILSICSGSVDRFMVSITSYKDQTSIALYTVSNKPIKRKFKSPNISIKTKHSIVLHIVSILSTITKHNINILFVVFHKVWPHGDLGQNRSTVPFTCRKRQLIGTVFWMRLQKLRFCVTAGVAR
jgi:ribosome-associated toxin RatA of RatAB toxin-antitoxin module